MDASLFLKNKIERQLKCNGLEYTFKRKSLDKFGQETDELVVVKTIKGLYHETNSYVTKKKSDASITTSKKSPMILALFDDALDIKMNDIVSINNSNYIVNDVLNIQNYSIAVNISLEEEK